MPQGPDLRVSLVHAEIGAGVAGRVGAEIPLPQGDAMPGRSRAASGSALGKGERIGKNGNDVVSAGICFGAEIGTAHGRRNALCRQDFIGVAMTAKRRLGIGFFQDVCHFVPIAQTLVQRVVIKKHKRLTGRQLRYDRIEPAQVFGGYEAGRHAHVGAAVATQKNKAAVLEIKAFVAENLPKAVVAAFRPFGVVVAGNDVPGLVEVAEYLVRFGQFQVGTEFGHVAGNDDKGQRAVGVDVGHGAAEVFGGRGRSADVGVGNDGKAEGGRGGRRWREKVKNEEKEKEHNNMWLTNELSEKN